MINLDEREAFAAMRMDLTEFYDRTGGDMATLMTDIEIQADGESLDPAAWQDWLRCVREVKGRGVTGSLD